ncbi:MAG: heavy-metal-associated domain-containing protein [Deltaproteobacteria bacterium]|nr:heavy-metal-associated domain-containing protein [Deltaproteobacteria bacterium]
MSEVPFTLTIEGMHCGNCVRRVKTALEAVDGVTVGAVEVGRATGSLDPEETTTQALADAVTRVGFKAAVEDTGP